MDSFFRFSRRLSFYVLLLLSLAGMRVALADACMTQAQAKAACEANRATLPVPANNVCTTHTNADGSGTVFIGAVFDPNTPYGASFPFCASAPPPPSCSSAAPITGTIYAPDGSAPPSGVKNGCVYYLSNGDGASNGTGQSAFKGTWTPTGASAPSGASDTPGFGADSTGNQPAQPKLCGESSCMDPNTGNICASTGSGSVCVQGPPGWTGGASGSPYAGGCASGGGGTVCAGSPPPSPPAPPASPISDPATQIKGSDQYQVGAVSGTSPTSQNMTNGMVTVNTYGTPGSNMSSGKTSGDNGPAPSSSTGGNSGSVSGGGDCNSPPVCSGDAVDCGILREQWQTMCQVKASGDQLHKDLAGDGTQQPPAGGQHTGSELTGATVDTGDTSQLDSSGFGWDSSCPLTDFSVTIAGVSASLNSFKPVCDNAGLYRAFVMLLASLGCAAILGGFKVGSIFGGSS